MPQPTALVADDEPAIRELLRGALECIGYSVTTVPDGFEAINALVATAYDLLVTDIVMPRADGFEVMGHALRHRPKTKIISISGGGQVDGSMYLEMAKGLGASSILKKPFTVSAFHKVVADVSR